MKLPAPLFGLAVLLLTIFPASAQFTPEQVILFTAPDPAKNRIAGAALTKSGDLVVTPEVKKKKAGTRVMGLNYLSGESKSAASVRFDPGARPKLMKLSDKSLVKFKYVGFSSSRRVPSTEIGVIATISQGKRKKATVRFNLQRSELDDLTSEVRDAFVGLGQSAAAEAFSPRASIGFGSSVRATRSVNRLVGRILQPFTRTGFAARDITINGTIPASVSGFSAGAADLADVLEQDGRLLDAASFLTSEQFNELNDAAAALKPKGLNFQQALEGLRDSSFYGILFGIVDDLFEDAIENGTRGVLDLNSNARFQVAYSWGSNQQDLDTATTFQGETVGFGGLRSSTYIEWTGDSTAFGGEETADVLVKLAADDGVLQPFDVINCAAGWYVDASGNGSSGPAMLSVRVLTDSGSSRSFAKQIQPGRQSGLATTPVGRIKLTYNSGTRRLTYRID